MVQGNDRLKKYEWKTHLPDSRGPLKVPPMIGITMRSCPLGTGPSENLSPSNASMLYRSVNSGGTGAS